MNFDDERFFVTVHSADRLRILCYLHAVISQNLYTYVKMCIRDSPNITVKAGTPVRWIIDVPKGALNGCNYRMVLRAYGISHTFSEGENVIEFTPEETGTVNYTCWMGMIRGKIFVTDEEENESLAEEPAKNAEISEDEFEMCIRDSLYDNKELKNERQ